MPTLSFLLSRHGVSGVHSGGIPAAVKICVKEGKNMSKNSSKSK